VAARPQHAPAGNQALMPDDDALDYYAPSGQQPMAQQDGSGRPQAQRQQSMAQRPTAQSANAPRSVAQQQPGQRSPVGVQRPVSRRPVTEFQNPDGPPVSETFDASTTSQMSPPVGARGAADAAPAPTTAARTPREAQYVASSDVDSRIPVRETAAAPATETVVSRRGAPSISVETIGPRKISVGKQATYKLVLKNSGDMSAADVMVTVAVPDWAEVVDVKATTGLTEPATAAAAEHVGLQWKLGNLGAQGREELTLEVVPRKSQPFELDVRWSQAPLVSQTMVEVQEPKLTLTLDGAKEVAFGERNTYKLTLGNPGTGDAESVSITLMPLNPADGAPASHTLGVLRPGEKKTIEIELVARQAGHVTIQAEATAAGDLKASLEEEVVVRRAALDVAIAGNKMQFTGTPATYSIVIKNSGNAPARNVRVACRLPQQAEHLASSSSGVHKADSNMVQWTVDTMEPGAELKLSTKCVLKATGQNKVEVSCAADGDLQQVALASTQVHAVADLALEVTDPAGPVPVGQDMTYEVRVRNRGSKGAESVDLVAYFANGIEPLSVEGGPAEIRAGMVVFRTIASLEPGRDVVYKIKARAEAEGNLRFRAELTCQPLDTKLTQEEATLFYNDAP